jgi:putative phage-type endonuclease
MSAVIAATTDRATWLETRRSAIGASDVAAILGVSPWASAWDVWAEKTGRLEPWAGNEATRLGQYFESAILDYADAEFGEIVRGERFVHDSLPIAATLDARIVSSNRPIEAKTSGLAGPTYGDWGAPGTDEVPDYYLCQVHTQLLVTEADLGYLLALLPGRGIVQYEVQRSEKLQRQLGEVLAKWWDRHIVNDIEPSREKASLEIVKRLKRVPSKSIELSQLSDELAHELHRIKTEEKILKEEREEIESRLLASLGDAEEGVTEGGLTITYFQQTRKAYQVNESTYRVLRVKKASTK